MEPVNISQAITKAREDLLLKHFPVIGRNDNKSKKQTFRHPLLTNLYLAYYNRSRIN